MTTTVIAEQNMSPRNGGLPMNGGLPQPTTTTVGPTDFLHPGDPNTRVHGGSAFYYGNSPEQQRWGLDETAAYQDMIRNPGPTFPTTWGATTSGGGGGGYGGGGGGGAAPVDYGQFGAWAYETKPQDLVGRNLKLPKYNTYAYRQWDPSQFNTARQGVATGIGDQRQRSTMAYDQMLQAYQAMQNPYTQGPQTTNPGVDPRLLASMQAWGGAGSSGAAQAYGEGVQADQAMGSVYDLLSRGQDQYQQGLQRGVAGDRMQTDQSLGAEQRMLDLAVNMAQARAKAGYDEGAWQHGRDSYNRKQDNAVTQAMANWQRGNAVADTNVGNRNTWNQDILSAILGMIQSGGKNIPQAGNDLTKLITAGPLQRG